MKWLIHVKSHCDYPDYESECEAETKEEAAKIFCRGTDWTEEDIIGDIISEEEYNKKYA